MCNPPRDMGLKGYESTKNHSHSGHFGGAFGRFQGTLCTSWRRARTSQGGVPNRLKLCPRHPFGHVGIIGDAISNQKVELGILDRPAQVPVRLNLVGGLVIPLGSKLSPLFQPPALGLADEIHSCFGVERRNAILGKLEVVGAVVEAFLRLGVELYNTALFRRDCLDHIVQVDTPRPIWTMSRVRPFTFIPSMLMSSAVRASGYSGCSA